MIQRISKSALPSSLKKMQPANSLLKRKLSKSGQRVELRGTNHSMPESDHKEADKDGASFAEWFCHMFGSHHGYWCDCHLDWKFHHWHDQLLYAQQQPYWWLLAQGRPSLAFTSMSLLWVLSYANQWPCPSSSVSGCDMVSSFFGKGNWLAQEVWDHYPEITEIFKFTAKRPIR